MHRLRHVARPAVVLAALVASLVVPSVNTLAAIGDITEFPVPTPAPTAITAGPDGNLWVTEEVIGGLGTTVPDKVAKMTTGGTFTEYSFPTVHSTPSGIATGPDGNLWITEHDHGVIDKVTTGGVFTQYTIPTTFAGPLGIVAGPDGNMWFTEGGADKVGNVTTSGVFTEYTLPTVGETPVGITVGSDGNLWFTEANTNKVGRVTTAGVITEFPVPTASSAPDGIALGSDGNVWVTEVSGNNVAKVTTAGVVTEYPVPTASSTPEGIALGSDGNMWFTEATANKVAKVTAGGVFTEFSIPTLNSNAAFMSAGPDGNVWLTESVGNKVARVLVNRANPTLVTQATASALTLGSISDTATLGGGSAPTGTITFDLYDQSNPTCTGTSTFQSIKTVTGIGIYASDPFPAVLPGTYRWVASYSGDINNNAITTPCNDATEISTVTKASPTITTVAAGSANPGDRISDLATLAGGNLPTGAFGFTLYRNDPTCSGVGVFASIITINGNASYASDLYTVPLPGTYSWVVFYGGDANNNTFTTACNDPAETTTVLMFTTMLSTSATRSTTTGGAMSDTATLSGGSVPTGTITFSLFGPDIATCLGTPVFTSTKTVAGGNGSYASDTFSPVLAGAYRWMAAYNGDAINSAAATNCNDPSEMTTVSKFSTTLGTFATASGLLGGTISDTGILSGGNAPTGTIMFSLFGPDNGTCSGTPVFTSTKTVTGTGRYPSDPFSPTLPGAYRWVALYSGDANNYSAGTSCDDFNETSTVTKASPTITTQATATANTGAPISDTAILAGGNVPTGAVTFSLFGPNNATCSGTPIFTSAKTVAGDGSYLSDPFNPALPGAYSWIATYGGDAFNNRATTACNDPGETSTVAMASPVIMTQATVTANTGAPISDTAILAGGNVATGTVTFSLFGPNNGTCSGTPIFTSTKTVAGDGSYLSDPFSAVVPGTYSWIASYGGDANNNTATTACNDPGETSTVTNASPAITTQATVSANTGAPISDIAILTGGNTPSGAVTFSLFGPNNATCAGTPLFTSTKTVAGDGTYLSDPFSPTVPGTYSWIASYGGDAFNNTATTACNDPGESSTVTNASPTITTQATVSAIAGGPISDTAILAGGNVPTGTITFTVFGPNNATCAGTPLFTSIKAVGGDGTFPSDSFSSTLPGTYSWVASYGGDAANNATSTACNDPGETSTVTSSSPTITTAATPSANTGGAISDTATLAGGSAPTGTITFILFGPNNASCSGTPVFTSTTAVNGAGGYPSGPFSPTSPGTYNWVAAYSGDANNTATSTACLDPGETSSVSNATPTISTSATPSASTGATISDTAILAGGNAPTGTITFTLFGPNNATCSGTPIFTSTKSVAGNGSYPSDAFSPKLPGAYSWVASYSGDAGNNAATMACNDLGETSTVTTAVISQDLKLSMFEVGGFRSGDEGAFVVIITNTGATDTFGILTFTDVLPAGLTFAESFTFDGWTCSAAGQTVTCAYTRSLPAHGMTALALFVRVTAPAGTVLTNTATIAPSDATPDDNTTSVTLTVGGSNEENVDSWSHRNGTSHEARWSGRQSQMEAD